MLTLLEAIKERRSIRKFDPVRDVPDEMVQQMLEAARLAPSGSNRQPWRFVVVKDKELRKKLREVALGQKFVEEAPVVFICFGDPEVYSIASKKQRRQEQMASGTTATLSGRLADPEFRTSRDNQPPPPLEQLLRPLTADTYIAIEHIILMAVAMGLGSCWVGAIGDPGELNKVLGVPDNLVPIAMLPVGYPAGKIPAQRPRLSLEEIVLKPQVQLPREAART